MNLNRNLPTTYSDHNISHTLLNEESSDRRIERTSARHLELSGGFFTSSCFFAAGCAFRVISTERFSLDHLMWLQEHLNEQNRFSHFLSTSPTELGKIFAFFKGEIRFDALLRALSVQDRNGKTPFHKEHTVEKLLPLLIDKLLPAQLKALLSLQDRDGYIPLHEERILNRLIPFLQGLPSEEIKEFFRAQDLYGDTLLHKEDIFEKLIPLLEILSLEELKELLCLRNGIGKTPLYAERVLRGLLPFLKRFSPEWIREILNNKSKFGTPLRNNYTLRILLPVLIEKFEPDELGIFLIIKGDLDSELFPVLLENLPFSQLRKILHVQDRDSGDTPLHKKNTLKEVLPLLVEKLSPIQLKELLSLRNHNHETPLGSGHMLKEYIPLLVEKLSFAQLKELLSVTENGKSVFSFLFSALYRVSKVWGYKEVKHVEPSAIEEGEYRERARRLRDCMQDLLDRFPQEEIKQAQFLDSESNSEEKYTFFQVKEAVTEMLNRIEKTASFAGTPQGIYEGDSEEEQARKKEELRLFYTPLLLNFEKIATYLQLHSPQESLGILFDIAKVQLGEFCATRYKDEILQKARCLEGEELEERDLFSQAGISALEAFAEKLARDRQLSGNVHAYTAIKSRLKLSSAQDPFVTREMREFLKYKIKEELNTGDFHEFFAEALRAMPVGKLFDWFYAQEIEESFKPEYEEVAVKVTEFENSILKEVQTSLLEWLAEEQIQQALAFFFSPKGAALRLSAETNQQWLQRELQKRFRFTCDEKRAKAIWEEGDAFTSLEEEIKAPLKDWRIFTQAIQERKEKLKKIKNLSFMQNMSLEQQHALLEQKMRYDAYMRSLANVLNGLLQEEEVFPELQRLLRAHPQLELSVNLTQSGSASAAVRSNRRMAFAAQFFTQNEVAYIQEITEEGILYIAQRSPIFKPRQSNLS